MLTKMAYEVCWLQQPGQDPKHHKITLTIGLCLDSRSRGPNGGNFLIVFIHNIMKQEGGGLSHPKILVNIASISQSPPPNFGDWLRRYDKAKKKTSK